MNFYRNTGISDPLRNYGAMDPCKKVFIKENINNEMH